MKDLGHTGNKIKNKKKRRRKNKNPCLNTP